MASVHDRAEEMWIEWTTRGDLVRSPEMHTAAWFWALACTYHERGRHRQAAEHATLALAAHLFSSCTCPSYGP